MTSIKDEFIPLPPSSLISQITTFKFFQDSIKAIYLTQSNFKFQILITQLSTSKLVYAWKQLGENGDITKVSKENGQSLNKITNSLVENAKLLNDKLDLIRINYNQNKNELFVLPDIENDLSITLIIEK
ncbi:hypothetical protein WICMUC_004775 [Wickerhamomyces mucosus]|uniref:Uncharacterized protein n=1 Tax=Wickerhamomyces mucosus TaxID=1378264 RepID=A0A9P8TA30_9ASCO|nr:hypothetical protein WICMUC_004775 [Wickerhamomyces mucosus]